MTEVIDQAGRWILTPELCEVCGCPSWDAFPAGVVAGRWTCQRCGHKHDPTGDPRQFVAVSRTRLVLRPNPHREDAGEVEA